MLEQYLNSNQKSQDCQSCGQHSLHCKQLHSCQISTGDEILFAIILRHHWLIYGSYVTLRFEFPCLSCSWIITLLLPPMRTGQEFQAYICQTRTYSALLGISITWSASADWISFCISQSSVLIRSLGYSSESKILSSQHSDTFWQENFSTSFRAL